MQAVDHLDGGRHLVDGRGQGLRADVDELADAEGRVLVEGPRPAQVEAGEDPPVDGWAAAVHREDDSSRGDVLADSRQQLDHAPVLGGQTNQPRPVDREDRAEDTLESSGVRRRQPDEPWRRDERRRGRADVALRRRERPVDRGPRLVGHGRDHPAHFEQSHGGGDVDEEHGDRQRQHRDRDHDGARGGRRAVDVVEGQGGQREGEAGQEDAERGLGDRGTHERAQDAGRQLRAGQLEGHQRDREDHPDEGQHRGRHHLQQRVGGAGPGEVPEAPVLGQAQQLGPGDHHPDQHSRDDQRHGDRPEPVPHPLAPADGLVRPPGSGRQGSHVVRLRSTSGPGHRHHARQPAADLPRPLRGSRSSQVRQPQQEDEDPDQEHGDGRQRWPLVCDPRAGCDQTRLHAGGG